jgi:pyruvate dehydrogenase E1 component beta subunit
MTRKSAQAKNATPKGGKPAGGPAQAGPTAEQVKTSYREAMRAAIREALQRDDRVFLMGEDVGRYGGCFAVSLGLLEEFGPERIRDTPLSESAFVGAGIGAAMAGMRPIVEIMTVNFSLLALDQIMNNAATLLHMSGGQCNVPLVIRMTTGAGRQVAAQHSHSLEGWYTHTPGPDALPASSGGGRASPDRRDHRSCASGGGLRWPSS